MNRIGTRSKAAATAPNIEMAGPIPRTLIIGLAASGNPAAIKLCRNVTAAIELAACILYTSIKKLRHCWEIQLHPIPMNTAARHGRVQ